MHTRIRRWGNSLAVRIPKAFAAETHLGEGAAVEISIHDGKLVIAPAPADTRLDDLLGRVTKDNLHGETDLGGAMGREVW